MADACANLSTLAELEPALQCKVDAFSAIEPHVEPGVIASRVGDDKLVLLLNERIDPDAVVGEFGRRDDVRFMAQELITEIRLLREEACI